jgi:capsular exopolysaccharide synthesis family protein
VERTDWDSPENSLSTLREYWTLLRKRFVTILVAGLVGISAALIVSLILDPVYKSWTTLEVQGINDDFMNMKNVDPTSTPGLSASGTYLDTQIKLLQSQSLINRTLNKLMAQGRPPLIFRPQDASAPAIKHPSKATWEDALFMAALDLEVRPSGFTRVVEIKTDSVDPQAAAMFVNTLASEFIQGTLENRWNSSQQTEEWLTRQLQTLKTKLENSEKALQDYARSSGLLFTTGDQSVAEEKLKQLQAELSKVQADRVTRQSQYGIAVSSSPEALPEILDQGPLRDYEVKLTDLRRELAELSSAFTPEHYKVKRVQAQISELETAMARERTNVVRRIKNDYQAAMKQEDLLAAEYAKQSKVVTGQADKTIRYNLLKREVESNRQLYESLLQRVKESGIAAAMQATNLRVVDPGIPSLFPYKPRMILNSLAGLVLGLMLGCGLVFVQERTNRSIQIPGEVSSYLNIRELGFIPAASTDPDLRRGRESWLATPKWVGRFIAGKSNQSATPVHVELATWYHKPSLTAESFRTTVTSILFANGRKDHPQVMVLTSSRPVEGKTTVVGNLGIAMADINRRVLLIDADLRKPRLHRIFDLPNTWGLSDLLRRDTPIKEAPLKSLTRPTEIPNLHVLPSGPRAVSISNLLYSPRLSELLSRFREEFDTVLIDTPPVIHIADARVLARLSDGVILVVEAHQTTREIVWMACQSMLADGAPILGAIVNKWDPRKSGERDYYSGYYRYYAAS